MDDLDPTQRQQSAGSIFDVAATGYDAWYETPRGTAILADELAALGPLTDGFPHPWLEIGVGTGRVAAALGIDIGVDPAIQALTRARERGISVVAARGEALPFKPGSVGAVVISMTLCFVANPPAVLREVERVLQPGGGFILGLVLAESPWGKRYRRLARQGHPYYRTARFLSWREVGTLLEMTGLHPIRIRSALCWPPLAEPSPAGPYEGQIATAGFTAVLATRAMHSGSVGHHAAR
jgi:ubiquinone/menaquinone biosynthesis C-methylase UbiE